MSAATVDGRRRPVVAEAVGGGDGLIHWRFGLVDHDGRWAWPNVGRGDYHSEVLTKLALFEQKSWNEVQGTGSAGTGKDIPLESLCNDAQRRLIDLGLDDQDRIAELRLTGPQRVWAVRRGDLLHLLWWDPEHEVCPTTR